MKYIEIVGYIDAVLIKTAKTIFACVSMSFILKILKQRERGGTSLQHDNQGKKGGRRHLLLPRQLIWREKTAINVICYQ